MEPISNNEKQIIGYCYDCKDPIYEDEDMTLDKKKLYCLYCWKVKHNITDELVF